MREDQPEQLAFLLLLGAERISHKEFTSWPLHERALVQRFAALKLNPRFWEAYRTLRGLGNRALDCVVGAWLATGAKGRGELRTLKSLAEALGKDRTTVYRASDRMRNVAGGLAMSWLAERVPDVDEATYHAAISAEGTAADRKLFYQRARTALSGEESEPVDNWTQVLAAVEAEIASVQSAEGAEGVTDDAE